MLEAKDTYPSDTEPPMHAAAFENGMLNSILQVQHCIVQRRSKAQEMELPLTPDEEKSIIRFCKTLEDLDYPLPGKMDKEFGMSLEPTHR